MEVIAKLKQGYHFLDHSVCAFDWHKDR